MRQETFSFARGATWRLEYSGAARGVWWRLIANFEARITTVITDEDGSITYRIEGRDAGKDGRAFSFEIPARRFNCHRSFMRALSSAAGAGSYVNVGSASALRRAIMDASNII